MMVGLKIKKYMEQHGVDPISLAKELNMPIEILSKKLSGQKKLSAEDYFIICSLLKVNIGYFL